jgi:hypothetical protein
MKKELVLASLLLAGCASSIPRMVDGIAIYERPRATVEAYCYNRLSYEERQQDRVFGCYNAREHLLMVEEGHPEVLAHELRHAQGWQHRGPCHSTIAQPDGIKPDGRPCAWYRP